MVLTEFHTMILGAVLHIYTDHLNITTNNTTPDHIIQWLIYDELFNPYIHFIPFHSWQRQCHFPITFSDQWPWRIWSSKNKQVFVLKDSIFKGMDFAGDPLLMECFLHLPPITVSDTNPTDYQWVFTELNKTDKLVKQRQKFPDRYFNKAKKLFVMPPLATMEILINQIHDLSPTALFPHHAWRLWLLPHACYAASQILPPASLHAHWMICMWQISTC